MNDGKAADKPRRVSEKKGGDERDAIIAELLGTQKAQALMLMDLESRIAVMEIAAPAVTRALGMSEIEATILEDRNTDFEVLEEWSFLGEVFQPGRRVRATYYDHLLDFVRSGLRLGLPIDGGKLNTAAGEARSRSAARASG